jgi:hypothetical protein
VISFIKLTSTKNQSSITLLHKIISKNHSTDLYSSYANRIASHTNLLAQITQFNNQVTDSLLYAINSVTFFSSLYLKASYQKLMNAVTILTKPQASMQIINSFLKLTSSKLQFISSSLKSLNSINQKTYALLNKTIGKFSTINLLASKTNTKYLSTNVLIKASFALSFSLSMRIVDVKSQTIETLLSQSQIKLSSTQGLLTKIYLGTADQNFGQFITDIEINLLFDTGSSKLVNINRILLVKAGWGIRDIKPNEFIDCDDPVCDTNTTLTGITDLTQQTIFPEALIGQAPVIENEQTKPPLISSGIGHFEIVRQEKRTAETIIKPALAEKTHNITLEKLESKTIPVGQAPIVKIAESTTPSPLVLNVSFEIIKQAKPTGSNIIVLPIFPKIMPEKLDDNQNITYKTGEKPCLNNETRFDKPKAQYGMLPVRLSK